MRTSIPISGSLGDKVNPLFTKILYPKPMNFDPFSALRLLVVALATLFAIGGLGAEETRAQSADLDWADAGAPSQGTVPSPTTVTGSDGTTATVSRTVTNVNGGTFTAASFAGDFLSYFNGQIGDGQSPLLLNFDNSTFDPADRVVYDIVLSRSVSGLEFALSDVDSGSNIDAIEVYYDDDLSGGFTNAADTSSFWTIGSSVTRTNDATVNGWRGTASSNQFTTDGDVAFDFGTTEVRRIRIVYFSYTGSGDPSGQFVGMSDLAYNGEGADLSLSKSLVGSPPLQNGTVTWRLTVSNNSVSTQSASGVVVRDTFPSSFTFSSANGSGSFNSGSGDWTVPTLAPGQSASITITGTVSASSGTTLTNTAEIIASSATDPDSTVNNGDTSEDDYASSTITVQSGRAPGVPPLLSCPAGTSIFDWDTISGWTNGSTDNTYAFASFGDIRFQLSNDGVFLNSTNFNGQTPTVFDYYEGGLTPEELSLHMLADQANRSGEVTITITLPRAFSSVQFSIFDVDFGSNQFADRVEVIGSNGGSSVTPTLTNGNANFVSGNVAIGDSASNSDQPNGNVVVTFAQAVDTITITYGNHTTAPSNPGQQGISIHDIAVCNPSTTLSVSKVSSIISDPVNGTTNPKAIPGAVVEYLITVTNTGSEQTDADSVVVWDDGPADAKMCLINRVGGPVIFNDPGSNSSLNYSFANLLSTTDDLEFSSNGGSTFTHEPSADGDGCDTAITDFRVNPTGAFAAGGNFTITVRYIVE